MKLTMNALMPRVEKGAAWLDANRPGWIAGIDLERLALEDCSRCVLGQLFGAFGNGVDVCTDVSVPSWELTAIQLTWAEQHGFNITGLPTNPDLPVWNVLRECWVTAILARRFALQQAQAPAAVSGDAAGRLAVVGEI